MPDTNNKNSESLAAQVKSNDLNPTVRTPDGQIDLVQTALNKMRAESGRKSQIKPGSSLREMTEWLKTHEIDSPKPTLKDWVRQEWDRTHETMADFRRCLKLKNIIPVFWLLVAVAVFCIVAGAFHWFFSIK